MWNEQGVAGAIIELGKKMLNLETAPDSAGTMTTMQAAAAMATATLGGPPPTKNTKKKPGASKKAKGGGGKGGLGKLEKEAAAFTADAQNEELKALEAYILKLSQQGKRCKGVESLWVYLLIRGVDTLGFAFRLWQTLFERRHASFVITIVSQNYT